MNKELIYLVQTDTTVGFSSSNDEKLSTAKQRPTTQKILQTIDSFSTLKEKTRVPKNFRKKIRRAKKSTFIYPNGDSFRYINGENKFYEFISKFTSLYSTSANLTKNKFDYEYASKKSDVIVFTKDGFSEKTSSSIYKINRTKILKIR